MRIELSGAVQFANKNFVDRTIYTVNNAYAYLRYLKTLSMHLCFLHQDQIILYNVLIKMVYQSVVLQHSCKDIDRKYIFPQYGIAPIANKSQSVRIHSSCYWHQKHRMKLRP